MAMEAVSVIVLAAGDGTHMRSERPKPLHPICGRPMVMHVLHALAAIAVDRTVIVVGRGAERVSRKVAEQAPSDLNVRFVEQRVALGTADAAVVGMTAFDDLDDIDDTSTVLVLPGDTPLLRSETVAELVRRHEDQGNAVTLLTTLVDDPGTGARVVRDRHGKVTAVRERSEVGSDLDDEAPDTAEVSTGVFAFRRDLLGPALRRLPLEVSALSDVVRVLSATGHRAEAMVCTDPAETRAVNDRFQLAMVERELRARTNRAWMMAGVTMFDPRQTFIDVTVELGRDVTLYPGTILQGDTVIGNGCEIGPDTRLVDCTVEDDVVIENSVCRQAVIGTGAHVGPYAVLGDGSKVAPGSDTGAFYTGV
jgi:bifunctional UDP-N-acetylglucosamine pyrophosphorylase / glucosamine-1-phosphate N-acetyltransferase